MDWKETFKAAGQLAGAAALAAILCGCEDSPRDGQGRLVARQSDRDEYVFRLNRNGVEYNFTYVMIDGHEYLLGTLGSEGFAHSPKCGCLAARKETGL